MPSRPERVLLLRSGRHLRVALDALAASSPGCEVTVVATAGGERAVVEAGVDPAACLVYATRPTFDAWPVVRGGLWRAARRRGYDRVAVLWSVPDGAGHANVNRAALALAPSGFEAITPDGARHPQRVSRLAARELTRAAWSVGLAAFLAAALYVPAAMLRLARACRAPLAGD
ncbi:MAG: hypothetical protein AB7H88_00820 [Vicinamibacterales bacterium]